MANLCYHKQNQVSWPNFHFPWKHILEESKYASKLQKAKSNKIKNETQGQFLFEEMLTKH